MHARALSPIAFALFVAGSAAAAAGPSFDCHTDRSPTEQAICGDPELGDLDSEMARLYFQIGLVFVSLANQSATDAARLPWK